MNLLVRLLREGQTAAAYVMTRGRGDRSADRIDLFEMLSIGDVPAYSRLRDVEAAAPTDLRDTLRRSYLPTIDESEWENVRAITRSRRPVHSRRWVTFVPVTQPGGLTVPDDDSPREGLSAFTDVGNETAVLTVPLTGPPAAVIVDNAHCTLPARGKCSRGCGSCELYEVIGARSGLVCICEHA